ncbi:MAG TPA: hypothetical protein VJT74_06780 [Pyrinomonadaceae bacterium]|nr:hypothetical protein [Pyrinomonadaceae bacterium]
MPPKTPTFPANSIFKKVFAKLKAAGALTEEAANFDPKTPDDVIITQQPREPSFDPTLGVEVKLAAQNDPPRHRLVAIGDSLTHGFQSGAIFNTDSSYPAIIAYELGWLESFRRPSYRGHGGLPLNIELLLRTLEAKHGSQIDWWETGLAAINVRHLMGEIEDWWERGPGSHVPNLLNLNHNLAVYGWDLRDVLSRTSDICAAVIKKPKDQLFKQLVENANERAALRVLNFSETDQARNALTVLGQATALGAEGGVEKGKGDGIETLIVCLGANNALQTITTLNVVWSGDGYADLREKAKYTVWRPIHFEDELNKLVAEVKKIKARHVIWGTVPHVTIAPLARGVGSKVREGSRYFPFYTRPWIPDGQFDDKDDPHITEQEARAIDSAIDQYNYCIEEAVRAARSDPQDPRDWYILDVAGILDRLACRRYVDDPKARPPWWTKYELPPELMTLAPVPDSKFFVGDREGVRIQGGLFALDGVHPTTIAYGLLAQEFINVMQRAGVKFFLGNGTTERFGPVRVDFNRLITLDTLISDPPRSIGTDLSLVGWFDEKLDFAKRMLRVGF